MKDPNAPTAKEKKTGFYKLFGMSKRQWDQEVKWAQARKNKQRREMKSFKTFKDITESLGPYAVVDKNNIIQFKGSESIAKKKVKDHPGGFIGFGLKKHLKWKVGDRWDDIDPWPDTRLHKTEDMSPEDELDEISTAQRAQRRRNRMQAHLKKTMAKYRAASKAGIHPSKVHQRRNKLTVKKT